MPAALVVLGLVAGEVLQMSDYVKPAPHICTVEELRDYLEWHIQAGRGRWQVELRERLLAVPPDGDTHDDAERLVFVRGLHPAM